VETISERIGRQSTPGDSVDSSTGLTNRDEEPYQK